MRSPIGALIATFVATIVLGAPVVGQRPSGDGEQQFTPRLRRAAGLIGAQDLVSAERELTTVLRGNPRNGGALNLLGVVRVKQQRAEEAEALFKQSISASPRGVEARINLGLLFVTSGQAEEGSFQFEEALKIAPRNAEAASHLVTVLRALAAAAIGSDPEKALSHLIRARALAPRDPEVLFEFAMAALRLTLHEDAIPALAAALAKRPSEPKFIYAMGRARLATGDVIEAERLFRRYTELRPEDPAGRFGLGYALAGLRRNAEARNEFESSLAIQPEQTESNYQLGLLDQADGNVDAAATHFGKVLARYADHTGALLGLGQVQFGRKQYEEARQRLERAVALEPLLQKAHYYLGMTYARLGDKEAATREAGITEALERAQKNQRRTILKLYEPEDGARPSAGRKP